MRHYVLPDGYDGSGHLELKADDLHYLTHVLRKRPGDRFEGTDGHGNRVSICMKSLKPGHCVLEISGTGSGDAEPGSTTPVKVTLFQCIPKANKMDMIVRQAVEAGVDTIVPVQSDHSVPRFDHEKMRQKQQRWQRIARQAMQQSGREEAPVIEVPVVIAQMPRIWREISSPGGICLLFHEEPLSQNSLHGLLASRPSSVGICVGPEGGFSQNEVAVLLNCGLQPVYIKTNVLRTETAALYAVAAVQTVILERDHWNAHP